MAVRTTSILTGGPNNHQTTSEEANQVSTDFLSEGIISSGDYAVTAQATPDMTVAVAAGTAYIDTTPTGQSAQMLRTIQDASENVTISNNSSGSTVYDWVYLKHDPDKANEPNVSATDIATLVTSRSTSSSTDDGSPPTYAITLAVITVANGATEITSGNITDKRTSSGVSAIADDAVTTAKIADSAVTAAKRSGGFKVGTFTPSTTGNLAITGVGFTPKAVVFQDLSATGTANNENFWGTMDEDGSQFVHAINNDTGSNRARFTSKSHCIAVISAGGSVAQRAAYVSMDADGFTVNFDSQNGTEVGYLAQA